MKWTANRSCSKQNLLRAKRILLKPDLLLFAILSLFIFFSYTSASFWPDDQDGVNYLLGIEQYDVAFHQPHFPGYPVYIAAGKLFTIFSGSPERACVFFSVFSGVICLWLINVLVRQVHSRRAALLCTLVLAVNPVFFEFSHKIFTEMPALALLIFAIVLLGNPVKAPGNRWFFAALVIGLMLGIRLSWWPFALFYWIKGIRVGKGFCVSGGLLLGILFWLGPQAAVVGPQELFLTGMSFTYGHFDKWGGAMGSELEAGHRFFLFAIRTGEAFGWIGSGIFWTRVPWIIFSLIGIFTMLKYKNYPEERIKRRVAATKRSCRSEEQTRNSSPKEKLLQFNSLKRRVAATKRSCRSEEQTRNSSRAKLSFAKKEKLLRCNSIKTFIIAVLFYMVWVVIGQNPEKVRHLLPLIPVFILALSPFIEQYPKAATAIILIFFLTLPLNYGERTQNNPPAVQFRQWTHSLSIANAGFYCGNSERFFDRYSTKQRVINVSRIADLPFVVKSSWPKPAKKYVCDDIPGFISNEKPVAIFPARKGDPVDRTLSIYDLTE